MANGETRNGYVKSSAVAAAAADQVRWDRAAGREQWAGIPQAGAQAETAERAAGRGEVAGTIRRAGVGRGSGELAAVSCR